jgi:hypothetical protein
MAGRPGFEDISMTSKSESEGIQGTQASNRWRLWLVLALVAVVATADFFSLRGARRPGGDTGFAVETATLNFNLFYVRSPLTVYLHQAAYHFIFEPMGRSPEEAIGFCSAVAGGIFVATLVSISTNWLFLLFNLSAPLMFIFLGHVEHYAWVNALLAVYFLAVKRNLENGRALWPAMLWLLLAASFHMFAVFYVPTLLYLLVERNEATGRRQWRPSLRDREIVLILLIVWAVWFCGSQMMLRVGGLDNNTERLVPLTQPARPSRYLFSLFSLAHLKMWLLFHWKSSPLGLALLVFLCWTIRTRCEKFLLIGVACGFLWTWMWHPDRAERDWDLFSNLALPLNILVGLLLARFSQRLNGATHESHTRTA